MTAKRCWNLDGRMLTVEDADQCIACYRETYTAGRFARLMMLALTHGHPEPIAARFRAALPPCPACGRPHDPSRIPPPRVPLTIRCACCCQD